MATVMNRIESPSIIVGSELADVCQRLRQTSVRLSGSGSGAGSGVIWHPDGLIVTNAHVARAPQMRVEMADGRVFRGTLLARDERHDLAALKVQASALPAVTMRDARTLRTGEMLIAVGNPLGAANAVCTGIVHRAPCSAGLLPGGPQPPLHGPEGRSWILADIRLAPGNSGGPLADADGLVVGVNSMIVDGFGCAVPAHVIASFLRAVT